MPTRALDQTHSVPGGANVPEAAVAHWSIGGTRERAIRDDVQCWGSWSFGREGEEKWPGATGVDRPLGNGPRWGRGPRGGKAGPGCERWGRRGVEGAGGVWARVDGVSIRGGRGGNFPVRRPEEGVVSWWVKAVERPAPGGDNRPTTDRRPSGDHHGTDDRLATIYGTSSRLATIYGTSSGPATIYGTGTCLLTCYETLRAARNRGRFYLGILALKLEIGQAFGHCLLARSRPK